MADHEFDRPLTEDERLLMCGLAVTSVAVQTGATEETAADALDTFIERGKAEIRASATDAWLIVNGKSLIHCARDWLAFNASRPDWDLDEPT